MLHQKIVIIAAGGTGTRLNADLPKQYMLLNGKPVLMHTIEAFVGLVDRIIIAIHPTMQMYWEELCLQHEFHTKHEIVLGGNTRFRSIQNAINTLKETKTDLQYITIAVHDAARPLVDRQFIIQSFELAQQGKNCTLAVRSINSIRIGDIDNSKSTNRDYVWQIQTPQTFPAEVLLEAYQQEESSLFTDDCSVVEKLGYSIQLIESNLKNIKITFAEDFEIAQVYLMKK